MNYYGDSKLLRRSLFSTAGSFGEVRGSGVVGTLLRIYRNLQTEDVAICDFKHSSCDPDCSVQTPIAFGPPARNGNKKWPKDGFWPPPGKRGQDGRNNWKMDIFDQFLGQFPHCSAMFFPSVGPTSIFGHFFSAISDPQPNWGLYRRVGIATLIRNARLVTILFIRNFGRVRSQFCNLFAILFEVLCVQIQEKIHHFAAGEEGF